MCGVDQLESQNKVVLESAERADQTVSEIGVEAEVWVVDVVPENSFLWETDGWT